MSTAEESAQALLAILPRINQIMIAELRRDPGEDTTMPQFRVLGYLAEEGSLILTDIARRRHVSLAAASVIVQALVERGWIMRTPDPDDRRQIHLQLTDAGRQQYEQVNQRMLANLIPLMALLSDDEITAVKTALHALERVLTGEIQTESSANDL
ncbi:MAG TPA: MarR family transcriptional regulator [Aggregatilineales bacterium]|nr:MarR family transcriptional regulator [Aggregatilineales bacterium]